MEPPLFNPDGSVAVPPTGATAALHRALVRGQEWRAEWAKAHGNVDAQHRIIRREYGLVEPMPEAVKAALRERAQSPEHKAKQKQKRRAKARLRALAAPTGAGRRSSGNSTSGTANPSARSAPAIRSSASTPTMREAMADLKRAVKGG